MKLETNGINLIKKYEGCKLNAYLCSAGVPTIGYGNTYYKDGTKVKLGDTITQEQANTMFIDIVQNYVDSVNQLVKVKITQNQFDALVSLCYNIGSGNFSKSSVLKNVNLDPTKEAAITASFMMWNKAKGRVITGLTNRRKGEIELYFKV
ncbi:MAG: lysozyme [Bacteroidetes bacterium]|nr:lysozyme [Bacteroidota bacterium]